MRMDKGLFTYQKHHGEEIEAPIYAWLITGGDEPVLVDPGCHADEFRKYSFLSREVKEIGSLKESLQVFGVSTEDIRTVVVTHLDTDHIANAREFSKAEFIVQEMELSFARNPHPVFARKFQKHLFADLKFRTVRGDAEIAPGIEVISSPGHTPGTQSVAVDTSQGKAVIAGYCTIDENFSEQGDIIPANPFDPIQAYESNLKVRKIADIIIPVHSPRYLTIKAIPG
jgi:glyoxylase-like metal-dependent hydrolase (beta-lactamase superfamily II)